MIITRSILRIEWPTKSGCCLSCQDKPIFMKHYWLKTFESSRFGQSKIPYLEILLRRYRSSKEDQTPQGTSSSFHLDEGSSLTAPKPEPGGGSTCDTPSRSEVEHHPDFPCHLDERSRLKHSSLSHVDECETTSAMDCDVEHWECDTSVMSSNPTIHTNVKTLRERENVY